MRKILVCGGREFNDERLLYDTLEKLCNDENVFIIQGGARGADALAKWWAEREGQPCATVNANWQKFGKSAGFIRNSWMLELLPDEVVAFPGGNGTKMMVQLATKQNIPVTTIGWDFE